MSHLLSCWDVCTEGLERRIYLSEDLVALKKIVTRQKWNRQPFSVDQKLLWGDKVIIVTDETFQIIHATKNMFAMNGYTPDDVIGRTPKIFQGKRTEPLAKEKIRNAINNKKPFEAILTNYKKDGSIYKCHVEGYPVLDTQSKLVNFIAFENAV
ncbi:MAG: PAS domain-containing protein [Bacteroidota bacterium]|nr:PAS domain-containing protein [Bacteroidota bacterium]